MEEYIKDYAPTLVIIIGGIIGLALYRWDAFVRLRFPLSAITASSALLLIIFSFGMQFGSVPGNTEHFTMPTLYCADLIMLIAWTVFFADWLGRPK